MCVPYSTLHSNSVLRNGIVSEPDQRLLEGTKPSAIASIFKLIKVHAQSKVLYNYLIARLALWRKSALSSVRSLRASRIV